jgi:hypothetical protein
MEVLQVEAVSSISSHANLLKTYITEAKVTTDISFYEKISGLIASNPEGHANTFIYDFVYEDARRIGVIEEDEDGSVRMGGRKFSGAEKYSQAFILSLQAQMKDHYLTRVNSFWLELIFHGGTSSYKPLIVQMLELIYDKGDRSLKSMVKDFKATLKVMGKSLGGNAQKGLEALSEMLDAESVSETERPMIMMFMVIVLMMLLEMLMMIEKMNELFNEAISSAYTEQYPLQDFEASSPQ